MNWENNQYRKNLEQYDKKEGLKALAVYCLLMASAFFQGWLYTTNLSVFVLNSLQIWIPIILLILFLCFLYFTKEKVSSIGINADNIKKSIILGIIGGFLLLAIQTILFIVQGKEIYFSSFLLMNWIIFIFSAIEEECLFRGYIQTRLSGLLYNQLLVGCFNSVLFLSIHYPVKWVVSGTVSFDVLSEVHIVSLIALHFFCDAVYKMTNCLWGAVVLHIIYNAVGAMIVIQKI